MKKNRFLLGATMLLAPITTWAWQGDVVIETPHSQLILTARDGGDLRQAYYGDKSATLSQLRDAGAALKGHAMPAFGTVDCVQLPALQVQHANGDLNLELQVTDYARQDGARATLHTFTMQDKLMPLTVRLCYKAYKHVDIIETWTEIVHQEKKAVTLKRFDSGHLTLRQGDVWVTHLHGNWGAETAPTMEPLTPGVKTIRNSDGTRNSHLDAPELMLSLDGRPQELTGRTVGLALCWSGNYELRLNTISHREHHVYAGIDPQASEYVLDPKETFETPHLAIAYSDEGLSGASRQFHNWARHEGMLHRGMQTGDILLNSWEGIYLDITEEKIIRMMDDIAQFGGELFVMDDGWFGDKYPRTHDDSSLGDWTVDARKLPRGISALTDAARQRGIKFGIWIEPEMTNTVSELYEQHPDWVLQTPGRALRKGRGGTQLVLDLCNPQVQDFVFGVVDRLMTDHPDISYIKWDANAPIQNYGSTYLPAAKQANLNICYHRGLISVLQRVRRKYPDLVIQDCASGGGRANYGLLPYFDEFWVSDNTDALQRVYMQYGTSMFFPANAMAQHINAVPYGNTGGRVIPVKFRCDVAMSGRLGIELQPSHMTDQERQQCTVCFNDYKQLRPVVQTGQLYRLVSPYERRGISSILYVDERQEHAVVFVYKTENFWDQPLPRLRLAGLDPARSYTLTERNVSVGDKPCRLDGKQFTGLFLMQTGIEVPLSRDYDSRVFELK